MLENFIDNLSPYLINLGKLITQDLASNLISLGFYLTAMVVYAIVIWHLYRQIAVKTLFKSDLREPKVLHFLAKVWSLIDFMVKSIIIFPFITFIWFAIFASLLLVLSKSQDVGQILLISISVIGAARITAYYNEDLSKDLAKLIPLALLGVFIVDPAYFSISDTLEKFHSLPLYLHQIIQYILAIILLEFVLRVGNKVKSKIIKTTKHKDSN